MTALVVVFVLVLVFIVWRRARRVRSARAVAAGAVAGAHALRTLSDHSPVPRTRWAGSRGSM